jgi:hypothetical protein
VKAAVAACRGIVDVRCVKRLLLLVIFGCCAGYGAAAELPPAPANGIRDNAHTLEDAVEARLAAEVRRFEQDISGRFWWTAVTFPPDGKSLRQHARELRQHWSGDTDAVLLAYDRVSDSQALSFSPGMWERYATTDLVMLMHHGALIMAEKQTPLEERLEKSARLAMSRLREMEQQRARLLEKPLPASHQRLAMASGALLGAGALAALFCGSLARRRDRMSLWQLYFPDVQVSPRFGAPHGGGVVVSRRC